MAEYRPIKTKIWQDTWFLSLTPEEKAVWFFLLTNQNVHISGIYEFPKTLVSPLVGTLKTDEILKKFENENKIIYKNGWIYIKNYLKNQTKQINKKDNIIKSIIVYLSENNHLIKLFNLPLEAPYKPLISPLPKEESSKEESSKEESSKEESSKELIKIPSQIMKEFILSKEKQKIIATKISNKYNIDFNLVLNEIIKFVLYWTEPSKSGHKQRWELQNTFELNRRLITWFNNTKNFNKSNKYQVAKI